MANQQTSDKEIDALRDDLEAIKNDVSSLVTTLKKLSSKEGAALKDKVGQSSEWTKAQAQNAAAVTAKKIEERPFSSVLVAFGIGLLIGLFLDRRR